MVAPIIDFKKVSKDLQAIRGRIESNENLAMRRTLNIVANRARNVIADDVYESAGISKGSAKRRMIVKKATRQKPEASIFISRRRVAYSGVRQLKKARLKYKKAGVSYIGRNRKRLKMTEEVRRKEGLGTKPFVIKGSNSGKKLAVYVEKPYRQFKTIEGREVTTMYYSSLAHLASDDWQQKVDQFSIKEFRKEYPKQLKKASFRGNKRV